MMVRTETEVPARQPFTTRVVRSPHFYPLLVIAGAVVLGNALYLAHVFNPNPVDLEAGLSYINHPGPFPGLPWADPNSGITAQALGHLAATQWLHGHIPWWNPFEGFGAPLIGEMQSAALFPPTLLLSFSDGQVYFHLVLELIAGCSTYLLLSELRTSRLVATGGAIAFALCGTFAWFYHAPENPVAFLPMLLLGIEYAARRIPAINRIGWITIAVALALSIYAGFPETTYIDGIFAGVWVVARAVELPSSVRTRFLITTAKGLVVGLLLAAPILVAFVDYLHAATIGANSGQFGRAALPTQGFSQLFVPYIYGPIDAFSNADHTGTLNEIWGSVGGYATASLLALGVIGLYGRRHRFLRIVIVLWLVLALGRTYGVPILQPLVNVLPGMKDVAFYRYAPPTWIMALVVLAALGFDDVLKHRVPRWWIAVAGASSALLIALSAWEAHGLVRRLSGAAHHNAWALASVGWAIAVIIVIVAGALFLQGRVRGRLVLCVLVLDTVAMFVIPQFSAPRESTVYLGPVKYLDAHLGTSRFYTIGPVPPDYGSYFGDAELNVRDLPEPKLYISYLKDHLGLSAAGLLGPPAAEAFVTHLPEFEAAGVKYLLTPDGYPLPALPAGSHLTLVYSAPSGAIYELPSPGSLYATSHCRVTGETVSTAVVTCTQPGSLVRRELYMKGWTAKVNGTTVPLDNHDSLQRVDLPAGRSVVTFAYLPPHMWLALLAFLVALALMALAAVRSRRLPRRASEDLQEEDGRLVIAGDGVQINDDPIRSFRDSDQRF
jgi:hypothetical protein